MAPYSSRIFQAVPTAGLEARLFPCWCRGVAAVEDECKIPPRPPPTGWTLFLTDGGIETSLIFQYGLDLHLFAAFPLLRDAEGRRSLVRYYERYIEIARANQTGFVLESPTWRASADWGVRLGYSAADIVAVNAASIQLMNDLRQSCQTPLSPMVVSGCIGPRGDG